MPIVELPVSSDLSLAQGDILKGLTFIIADESGNPRVTPDALGLVLSRNCNAIRDKTIIVVEILPYSAETFTNIDAPVLQNKGGSSQPTLDDLRKRFDALRDGLGQPDQFYLGTLPSPAEEKKRYAAQLDRPFTITLPTGDARTTWIIERRIARLSCAHRRLLHARLFSAFAIEGFDDYTWWCDNDLEMMIIAGRRELRILEDERDSLQMSIETGNSKQDVAPKEIAGRDQRLKNLLQKIENKNMQIQPFIEEKQRRR